MAQRTFMFIGVARPAVQTVALLAILLTAALGAQAQSVVDSYAAVIAPQDRVNSRGSSLSDVGAIIAQDRANFHRFGISQPGDEGDTVFNDRRLRAAIPQMMAGSDIAPDARLAIAGSGSARVFVEILQNGGAMSLRVRLANSPTIATAPVASGSTATTALGLPTFLTPTPASGAWQLSNDPTELRGIAAAQTATGARVALECTRPGATAAQFTGPGSFLPHQPGVLNLLLDKSALSTLPAAAPGQTFTVALAIDGAAVGTTVMALLPDGQTMGTSIPSTHPILARLGAGAELTLQDTASGAGVSVPLSGLAQAIDALLPICIRPAGQPSAPAAQTQIPTFGAPLANATQTINSAYNQRAALVVFTQQLRFHRSLRLRALHKMVGQRRHL